ncbi:MAG: hypothetical protein E7647_02105 [Ruminococcaceae bacterium]|nr:hypothetical protein [Oscillospiraceae bacterium]
MKNENKFLEFIRRFHIIPKIVCVILAFIFWIYVMEIDSPDNEDTFEDIYITVVGTTELENEKNLSVFSGYDTPVDVTVKGQKSVISKYTAEDIVVTVDVSDIEQSGMYTLELFYDLPSGLTLVESSAKEVNMFIDRRTSANIAVEPQLKSYKISTADYALGDVTCDTQLITVTGPESVINEIDKAVVEVNMGDEHLTQSISTDGTIVLKRQNGETVDSRYLKLSKNTVSVNIPVLGFKSVPLRVSTKHGFYTNDNSTLTVEPQTIRIKGEPSALQNIEYIDITTIDEKKIGGDTELNVDINLPENVYAADGQPTVATVSIKLNNFIKKTFVIEKFLVINSGDLDIDVIDESVAVTVIGERGAVNRLKLEDIVITVDFANYMDNTGIVNPPVTITIYSEGTVYELGFYDVQVQIK